MTSNSGQMFKIGITGGIGSGKSTVTAYLRQRGYPVVDADEVARKLVAAKEPVLRSLVETFGEGILTEDGELDRSALAKIAFSDANAKAALDRITHGPILEEIRRQLGFLQLAGQRVAFVDAALLVETGLDEEMDEVWVLIADKSKREERVASRDRIQRDQIRARIQAQLDDRQRIAKADQTIENNGSIPELLGHIEELLRQHENQTAKKT